MANITKVALVNKGKVVGAGRNKDNSNLAPIETTTTASRSYLVGDYLMLQGEFYRVIQAISIGNALVVGTNIQATSVGEEIIEVNNKTKINYSTTEHIIGTWIDGKPLYEKTVDFGALPNKTTKSVAHGLTNFTIRNVSANSVRTSDNQCYIIPHIGGSHENSISIDVSNTNVTINTLSADRSAFYAYVTLRYTKTTD